MAKKFLLLEIAFALAILILELLIEEAVKLSLEGGLSDKLSPIAKKLYPRPKPFMLAGLCVLFSLATIMLLVVRFFQPATGSRLYVYGMHALHFLYCVATVTSSSLEILKFYGLHLKHFSNVPLILAAVVAILLILELAYELLIASRAGTAAIPNAAAGNLNADAGAIELTPFVGGDRVVKLFFRY